MLRKGLRADYYTDPINGSIAGIPADDWPLHISHCLEDLRQGVMCAADIRYFCTRTIASEHLADYFDSLEVWQWDYVGNKAAVSTSTIHSCRNYDKIVDWAKAHQRVEHWDVSVHIEDDIVIPPIV